MVFVGEVVEGDFTRRLELGAGILLKKQSGRPPAKGRSEAVLIILEPGQSSNEVAETVRGALR
jgi:hypothetical protein